MPLPRVHMVLGKKTIFYRARRFVWPAEAELSEAEVLAAIQQLPKRRRPHERRFLLAIHVNTEVAANLVAAAFSGLFLGRRHFSVLAFLLTANLFLLLWASAHAPPPEESWVGQGVLTVALTAALLVFHELGHAAACRAMGIRVDGFGAGIYLIFPAFFTKISMVSELDRRGRLIVYTGGVYFQAIAGFAVGVVAILVPQNLLLHICWANIAAIVFNLIPVMKFDGYKIAYELFAVVEGEKTRRRIVRAFRVMNGIIVFAFLLTLFNMLLSAGFNISVFGATFTSVVTICLSLIGMGLLAIATPDWIRRPLG